MLSDAAIGSWSWKNFSFQTIPRVFSFSAPVLPFTDKVVIHFREVTVFMETLWWVLGDLIMFLWKQKFWDCEDPTHVRFPHEKIIIFLCWNELKEWLQPSLMSPPITLMSPKATIGARWYTQHQNFWQACLYFNVKLYCNCFVFFNFSPDGQLWNQYKWRQLLLGATWPKLMQLAPHDG